MNIDEVRPTDERYVGPPPPFDPECNAALEAVRDQLPIAVTPEMLPEFRATSDGVGMSDDELAFGGTYEVCERTVPGPDGAPDIALLIAVPRSATKPVPALFNIHGGGMVAGDRRTALHGPAGFAAQFGCAIVSVEYRLAPEHPAPAPVDDCYAGLEWLAQNAITLGIDPARLIIVGISGGGGLAAATALIARDRGGPDLYGQLLMCPMLDDRNNSVSAQQMAGIGVWDQVSNDTGWTSMLGDRRGGADVTPYDSPARATDLSGLPPTLIDVGSAETFRDEAVEYATRIWQAGGQAELHVWPGGFHGFDVFAPKADISRGADKSRRMWLARLLGQQLAD